MCIYMLFILYLIQQATQTHIYLLNLIFHQKKKKKKKKNKYNYLIKKKKKKKIKVYRCIEYKTLKKKM